MKFPFTPNLANFSRKKNLGGSGSSWGSADPLSLAMPDVGWLRLGGLGFVGELTLVGEAVVGEVVVKPLLLCWFPGAVPLPLFVRFPKLRLLR